VERILELTDGAGADVVLDVAAVSVEPVLDAIRIAKRGGTVMLAGMKGSGRTIPGFSTDTLIMKELTLRGMNGQDLRAYEPALRLIESGKYPLEKMATHSFPLEEAEKSRAHTCRADSGRELSQHHDRTVIRVGRPSGPRVDG